MNRFSWTTALALAVVVPVLVMGLFTQSDAYADQTPTAAEADPMQFARGAKTWANTCARCHNMRDPKEMRDEQWQGVIAHMRVRASLTGGEARDVLKFLQESN